LAVNVKTYANFLQAALDADSTLSAYCNHVVNIDLKADEDIEDVIKRLMGDNRYMILITEARIADKVPYGSNNTWIYTLNASIYACIVHGGNFDVDNNETLPVMGSPYGGESVEDMAADINNLLNSNKLTSNYLELGGEIIETLSSMDMGNGMHYVELTHEGRLYV